VEGGRDARGAAHRDAGRADAAGEPLEDPARDGEPDGQQQRPVPPVSDVATQDVSRSRGHVRAR
jgi:hypothetical protein